MQKTEVSGLLKILLQPKVSETPIFILCDEPLLKEWLKDSLKIGQKKYTLFSGTQALTQFNKYLNEGDLFSSPQLGLVLLPEKLESKNLKMQIEELNAVTSQCLPQVIFFAPSSYRQIIKKELFSFTIDIYLAYQPTMQELDRCYGLLIENFFSRQMNAQQKRNYVQNLHDYYGHDLLLAYQHCKKAYDNNLSFEDSFMQKGQISAFNLLDSLAEDSVEIFQLRYLQFLQTSEDEINGFFYLLSNFLSQLIPLWAGIENKQPFEILCKELHLPFPVQQKARLAIKNLNGAMVLNFYLKLADFEMLLRTDKFFATQLLYHLVELKQ